MKDEKKTVQKKNTTKKPNTVKKKHDEYEKNNNMNKNVSEAPRVTKIESPVKETKNVHIDDDFIDEEDDKKLIVVITIAILVIIATIIGLLVGCERQEEPEQPKDDEIDVPVEKEDEDEEEETEKVVVKLSTTKADKKEEKEEVVEVKVPTYDVVYYYANDKTHHESAKEGETAKEYVPSGYHSCKYYKDVDYTEEYTFTNVYENTNIYLNCQLIEYTVIYEDGYTHENPTTFTVESEIELTPAETEKIFIGWYLDNEFTNEVTTLNKNLVKHADEENTIYLYVKTVDTLNVKLYDEETKLYDKDLTKEEAEGYILPDAAEYNICGNSSFLGWTESKGTNNVDYKNKSSLKLNKNYELYAVCGDATVVYTSNGETVTVGYTNEQLKQEGIELPAPSILGMETPVYFVPVDEETLTSKKVVSDDEIELGENEVYLSQVTDNTKDGYTPNIGDNVESFEKEFLGWVEKTEEPVTEETTTPNEEATVPGEETTSTEEETLDFVETMEDLNEIVEESTETPAEVELEAVWGIPEAETTPDTENVDTTPEVEPSTPEVEPSTPEVAEVVEESLPVA